MLQRYNFFLREKEFREKKEGFKKKPAIFTDSRVQKKKFLKKNAVHLPCVC
jgi:hypothetical protein